MPKIDRDSLPKDGDAGRRPLQELPSLSTGPWQMSFGERVAIEGILAQLQPRLALEIGTAEGGSLRRIAAHSARVISFDLVEPRLKAKEMSNVELRTGDSHSLLPLELERLAAAGENVDFVLIDGDHSAEGARRDMEDVLASEALRHSVVLAHDTLNPDVRSGLEAVPYGDIEKVGFIDLDFIGGYVPADPPLRGECWGGLGLVIVDETREFSAAHEGGRAAMVPLPRLVWSAAEALRGMTSNGEKPASTASEPEEGRRELEHYRRLAEELQGSLSWRVTAPLRTIARRFRRS